MKISLGNFGNTIARPGPAVEAPASAFGVGISQAAGRLADGVGDLGRAIQANDDAQRRANAAVSLAQLDNDVRDLHDNIGREVEAGTIKASDAIPTYRQRVQDLQGQRLGQMDADTRQLIEANVIRTTGAMERNLQGVVVKRQQSEIGGSLNTLGEQFQRNAMRDLPGAIAQYHGAVDTMGPQAGWTPEQITKAKNAFTEGATFNFANATLEGTAASGNAELIRGAMGKISGPEGEAIDPAKRTALMTKGYGYLNGIEAANVRATEKAEREQLARENQAVDAYNKVFDLSAQGRYLSQEAINDLAIATAGTAMAGPAQELVKSQSKVAGFASMSLPQQQAVLERQRAAGSDPKIGVSPVEQQVYKQMDSIYTAGVRAYKDNPWQAAQERGVIRDAPTITLNNVQDAQNVIGQRMQQIGQVEVAAGRKVSPLQPEEAQTIGRLVRALPPEQQASALAAFGGLLGDADRVSDLARQMSEKDKTIGMAMAYANSRTSAGRYTSELVLRGERALKDGSVKVDSAKETGWRAEIAGRIGDATLNQDVRQQWIDAAYLIQASIAADGGGTDIRRAVDLATGGLREQRDGSKVPRPYGMSDDTFTQRLGTLAPADLSQQAPGGQVFSGKTAIPLDQFIQQLPQASLVHAGQGRYAVRAGQGFVTNSAGQRITIDLNPRRPVASPPNGQQGMPKGGR
ncbi:hypothetical protein [Cupriavidus oxalaticus]|uniref:hypothetical protein n=1 Tax=Cupriavidus oxalaticus TaxID=96344 RepID=UPI00317BBB50